MARWLGLLLLACALGAQQTPREQVPPEEDENIKPTEYSFNPLQAAKEMQVGNHYSKKGSYRAAALRYREATKWDPTSAEAWLKLGEAEEKRNEMAAAREAYAKYIELAPDGKKADDIRKKLRQGRRDAKSASN
jgi:tetratricopeptide (TPR) repeat protein